MGAILLVPVLVTTAALAFGHARGPYWLGYKYDPEYGYLLNGLNVAEGVAPWHTDHPGTPLQLLAGGTIRLAHAATSPGTSLRADVLTRPEFFLAVLSAGLLVLQGLATALLGWAVRRSTGSLMCAVGAQAAPSLGFVSLEALCRVTPEPLQAVLAIALSALTVAWLRREPPGRGVRYALGAGVLLGVAVATKVTFLPLALAWLFIATGVRARLVLAVGALGALTAMVLPILSRSTRMLKWFTDVVVHSGRYGKGAPTVIDPGAYPGALWHLVRAEPLYVLLVLASAALLVAMWRVGGPPATLEAGPARRALLGLVLAQALQFAVVGKDPTPRYLTPAVALLGLNVVLVWSLARACRPGRARGMALAGLALVLAGGLALAVPRALNQYAAWTDRRARQLAAYEAAQQLPGARVLVYYGSSSPAVALDFGDYWAGQRYSAELQRMFPGAAMYEIFGKAYRWVGVRTTISPEQVEAWARDGRLVFQGPPRPLQQATALDRRMPFRRPDDTLPTTFRYTVLLDTGPEGLFEARPR